MDIIKPKTGLTTTPTPIPKNKKEKIRTPNIRGIRLIEKFIYGYLIHSLIYFYILHKRLPKSLDELIRFSIEHVSGAREDFTRLVILLGNNNDRLKRELLRVGQIVWGKIHRRDFQTIIREILKEVSKCNAGKLKFFYEKEFIVTTPNIDKYGRPSEVKLPNGQKVLKIFSKKIIPDIILFCDGNENKFLTIIDIKSGNRRLWAKYEKQVILYLFYILKYTGLGRKLGKENWKNVKTCLFYYKYNKLVCFTPKQDRSSIQKFINTIISDKYLRLDRKKVRLSGYLKSLFVRTEIP